MNGRQMPMERVPLTEAEKEYLAPILDRYEQIQKEIEEVQKSVNSVVKLFMSQHKDELKDGPEWQLGRDAFVRPRMEMPPAVPPNGQIEEDTFTEIMSQ